MSKTCFSLCTKVPVPSCAKCRPACLHAYLPACAVVWSFGLLVHVVCCVCVRVCVRVCVALRFWHREGVYRRCTLTRSTSRGRCSSWSPSWPAGTTTCGRNGFPRRWCLLFLVLRGRTRSGKAHLLRRFLSWLPSRGLRKQHYPLEGYYANRYCFQFRATDFSGGIPITLDGE